MKIKKFGLKKYLKNFLLILGIFILTSCSALQTSVAKRNLDIQTKMSETIWLDPVSPSERTIFLQIRNTSGKNLVIEDKIARKIREKGYKIVDDPSLAKYWLQANILKVDKVNLREGDLGAGLLAGGLGAMLGAQRSGGVYTAIGWGLAAATISTVADALVEDINYAMLTDILITEKTDKQASIIKQNNVKLGASGTRTSLSQEIANDQKYSTRVLSVINKVNLKFEEAIPFLEDELVNVISGIF